MTTTTTTQVIRLREEREERGERGACEAVLFLCSIAPHVLSFLTFIAFLTFRRSLTPDSSAPSGGRGRATLRQGGTARRRPPAAGTASLLRVPRQDHRSSEVGRRG